VKVSKIKGRVSRNERRKGKVRVVSKVEWR
jgi:hypothetical protein